MDHYLELLKHILPEFLIEHFDLTKQTTEGEVMHLYFEEKNNPPKEVSNRILTAHGFHKEITIQDFPCVETPFTCILKDADGWIRTQSKSCRETGT